MENLQTNGKYNFLKKFKFYAVGVITAAASLLALKSCSKKDIPGPDKTPTTIENPVSPTDAVTPTSEITVTPTGVSVTPTGVVTPEPTVTPTNTPTPTPTPALAEKKLSAADICSKEFVETEYFDTNKPVEEQIEDRKEYLATKEDAPLSDNEIDTLVKCINKDTTQEAMTQSEINSLSTIVNKVFDYNYSHQDDMIPLSKLGINLNENEKIVYNYIQCLANQTRNEIPKSATSDDMTAHDYIQFYVQLSGRNSVLKPTVQNGDTVDTKLMSRDSIDTSCEIITYLYAIKALEPYKNTAVGSGSIWYINILLEEKTNDLKTVENSNKTLQK